MYILSKLSALIIAGALSLNIISAPVQAPTTLGAAIPSTPALFDGYLASGITNTATTMTLSTGVLRNGVALSGYTCFVIDVNQPTVEYVCGTASGVNVTGLMRGVDVLDPTSSSTAQAFSHRRFASVSISDYPTIQLLVSRVNTIIASGTANYVSADEGHIGYVSLATGAQIASGTSVGSLGARMAIGSNLATSTYNAGASYVIPVTGSTNKIDSNFISTSTLLSPGLTFLGKNGTFGGSITATGTNTFGTTTLIIASSSLPSIVSGQATQNMSLGSSTLTIVHNLGYIPRLVHIFAYGQFNSWYDASWSSSTSIYVGQTANSGGPSNSDMFLFYGGGSNPSDQYHVTFGTQTSTTTVLNLNRSGSGPNGTAYFNYIIQ